jgi:hypothetical protein
MGRGSPCHALNVELLNGCTMTSIRRGRRLGSTGEVAEAK